MTQGWFRERGMDTGMVQRGRELSDTEMVLGKREFSETGIV